MLKKAKLWHSGLSKAGKVVLWAVTVVVGGTIVNSVSANSNSNNTQPQKAEASQEQSKDVPVTEKKMVTESLPVPFSKTTIEDGNLEKGKSAIKTPGVNGVKTITYEVTYVDGKESSKTIVKEEVTTVPVTEVTALGTYIVPKVAPKSTNCDPNYSECVPIASDVDCAGGSGNGPAYVSGPVTVIGSDIYDLDRDGNGFGCE